MTTALAAGCGVLGLAAGVIVLVVVERVPDRASIVARPFPEVGTGLRTLAGWGIVVGTGLLFAAMALRFGDDWALPAFLLLAAALVALSVIDLRSFLLPNRIIYPVAIVSIVWFAVAAVAESDVDPFLRALACAAGALLVFVLLHLISPRAMGFGDVRLAFLLGLDLGWLGTGEVVLGLLLGFFYGAVIGLVLLATRMRSRKDHVPFGPFLAAGAITAILVGDAILDWYIG
jgi:leader peptidase (prepilin peptidase)/N-methyltransferase